MNAMLSRFCDLRVYCKRAALSGKYTRRVNACWDRPAGKALGLLWSPA